MKIKYVGPFWKVEVEGVSLTRHLPVEVDAGTGTKLLRQLTTEGKPLFEEIVAEAKTSGKVAVGA